MMWFRTRMKRFNEPDGMMRNDLVVKLERASPIEEETNMAEKRYMKMEKFPNRAFSVLIGTLFK